MKIRSDFVTNSSSSSFVLAFKDENEINRLVDEEICSKYSEIAELKNDIQEYIQNGNQSIEDIVDYVVNDYDNDWKLTFHLMDKVGKERGVRLSYEDTNSEWFKLMLAEEIKKESDKLREMLNGNSIFAIVEYGDGMELEYELPHASFTKYVINHH